MTSIRLRPLAETDLIERTRYYRRNAGGDIGESFFDAAIKALDSISRMPRAGSPRVGESCGIPGLRAQRVIGFPASWYYFVTDEHADVVRLLADAQDLPSILTHDLT